MDRPSPFPRWLTQAVVNLRHDPSCWNNPHVMLKTPLSADCVDDTTADALEVRSEYLLVCEARSSSLNEGSWHFTLETADGAPVFDAGDDEIGDLNRLTLLAAVRGLEAIDGSSAVTLLSNNRYLIRSLSDSLPRWRENDFVWEHFGRRIDVQHADLWRRIDRALSIHRVEACLISSRLVSAGCSTHRLLKQPGADPIQLRVDSPHPVASAPKSDPKPKDQLRRWLLGGSSSGGRAVPRRRFTSADLMETA